MRFGYRDLTRLLRLQRQRIRDRWSEFLGDKPPPAKPSGPEIETTEITPELLESHGMQGFFEVWQRACASRGKTMPMRGDIDIVELGTYIGELSLLEVIDGGADFRYRVLSEGAAVLLGKDHTGKLLSETDRDAERRERLTQRYRRVVATRVPWYSRTPAIPEMPVLYTARLALPLSEDGEQVSMILMARKSGPRRPLP
ncbi:MAG: PAS domain-containing protein [Proteobacteria bacterium]|nr:PAS domain-containing protein [Pseudomonadota bacterium]MBI3499361.1 PAS domain-containing protein [Pseudomonadota bacterium]